MEPLNQVNIEEESTIYKINLAYHSDMKCQNYDAQIMGLEESDGRITIRPSSEDGWAEAFTIKHSDPDRIIALAQMILAFAQMVKNNNKKTIDASTEA